MDIHMNQCPNLDRKLISAILVTSASFNPRPNGGAAMRRAYSPSREFRNGKISSVCDNGQGKETC